VEGGEGFGDKFLEEEWEVGLELEFVILRLEDLGKNKSKSEISSSNISNCFWCCCGVEKGGGKGT